MQMSTNNEQWTCQRFIPEESQLVVVPLRITTHQAPEFGVAAIAEVEERMAFCADLVELVQEPQVLKENQ